MYDYARERLDAEIHAPWYAGLTDKPTKQEAEQEAAERD